MSEERRCLFCDAVLTRKTGRKTIESTRDFLRRNFCDKRCSGAYSKRNGGKQEEKAIKQAEKDLEGAEEPKRLSAYDYLDHMVNDANLDTFLRFKAATALIPYQAKRKGESSGGKKEGRKEAAEKVAKGKFQPGAPPAKIVNINGGK